MFTITSTWKKLLLGLIVLVPSAVIVILVVVYFLAGQELPSVTTNYGKIVGHYRLSSNQNEYEAYEGIPYALPPTGQRRFEPAQPIEPWTNALVTDKFKEACVGFNRELDALGSYVGGVEDCLYLNVYAPKAKVNQSLPVIFWIYGGAFQYSTLTGDEQFYLIDHDIIFVSFNYRHGSLGFLSTEDEVVPGNMGLKDQSLALRWVSENIKFFGGDPKRIMLAGSSAGGASVQYHYLSPMSKGLFQSGISFSGTALDPWAQAAASRAKAFALGMVMKCPTKESKELLECLKNRTAEEIVAAQAVFMPWHLNEFAPFGPVVEKTSNNSFIDRSPIDIIRSNHSYDVPWVTGVVKDEGLFPVAEFITNKTVLKDLNAHWNEIAPQLLQYYYIVPEKELAAVGEKIREHYFGNESIDTQNSSKLIQLVGDRLFVVDAEKAAREMARFHKSPVWFYYYTYRANTSLSDYLSKTKENLGTSHADDVLLVLGNAIVKPNTTANDLAMHNELVEFWLSVARNSSPEFGPIWHRVDANNTFLQYLRMSGPEDFSEEANDNLGQKNFWKTIPFK